MSDDERIKRVEEAIVIIKDLIVRYDERIDIFVERLVTFDEEMKKSREDLEFKINAVVDSQIRNYEQIAKLNISTNKLEIASRSQLGRIEKLETA